VADAGAGCQIAESKDGSVDQYLMDRNAEIALARSAAPESIAKDAEIMVLGPKGYETAVKGKNGFVCVVHRSWTSEADDPSFGIPSGAVQCVLTRKRHDHTFPIHHEDQPGVRWASEAQMFDALKAAFENKELPALEPGANVLPCVHDRAT